MTTPRPSYVLRLTGEQIGSIDPPPEGDWFTDWDEYEDFVSRRMLDARTADARVALTLIANECVQPTDRYTVVRIQDIAHRALAALREETA